MSYCKTFNVDSVESINFGGIEILNYGDYAERSGGLWQNGQRTRNNYGCHTMGFRFLGVHFYFSYDTLIAFYHPSEGFCFRKNRWGVNTSSHLSTIWRKFASHLGEEDRHEDLSKGDFHARLYNVCRDLGIDPTKGMNVPWPKELMAIETGEIVDAKHRDNIEDIQTPDRTWNRKHDIRMAKRKEKRRIEGIKKGVATRKRNRERAIYEADRYRREEEIRTSAFLQEEDLPSDGEEMIA